MGYPSPVLTYPYCRYWCSLTAGPHLSLVGIGARSGWEGLDSLSLGDTPIGSHAYFPSSTGGQKAKESYYLKHDSHFVKIPQTTANCTIQSVISFNTNSFP